MKKILLIIFFGIFLVSCGNNNSKINETNSGNISEKNIEKTTEKEEFEAKYKVSADLVTNFEVEKLNLDMNLSLNSGNEILHLQDFVNSDFGSVETQNGRKERLAEYKKALDDKKSEILKEFPEIEKNLIDSDEEKPGFDLGIMFQAFTDEKTEEKPGNKISVKIEGDYNPNFKGSLYDFPFYQYYGIIKQEPMMFSDILLAKNLGKNKYSMEITEEEMVEFAIVKSLMTGFISTGNNTFEKFPDKVSIDFSSVSEIYKKYLGKEGNKAEFSFGEGYTKITKIEYNDGKEIDLKDSEKYSCNESGSGTNYCYLNLLKIIENDFPKSLTIYVEPLKN